MTGTKNRAPETHTRADESLKAAYLLGRKQWCPAGILDDHERTERDWQKARKALSFAPQVSEGSGG